MLDKQLIEEFRESKFDLIVKDTHPWRFSKSKFNLKSDRVNLVAPARPIECLLYLPNVRAIQYTLGRKGWHGSEIQMYYSCPWRGCSKYKKSYVTKLRFNRYFFSFRVLYPSILPYTYKEIDLFLTLIFNPFIFATHILLMFQTMNSFRSKGWKYHHQVVHI